MADSKLGTAVVAIRAALDQFDKDLGEAKAKADGASKTIGGALGAIKWGAIGGGVATVTGALSDLAREGAADAASMEVVRQAVANANGQFEANTAKIAENKFLMEAIVQSNADASREMNRLAEQIKADEAALVNLSGSTKETAAAKAALKARIQDAKEQLKLYNKETSDAAAQYQELYRQTAAMESALNAQSVSVDEATAELDAYMVKMRDTAAIDDGDMKPALAGLIAVTGDYQRAMELASIAADLARGKNMSLQSAAQLVGRVAQGNTSILTRYGIQIDKNATAEEALAALQQKFAGQAEAYGATAQGQMERIGATIGDFRESLGQTMGPAMAFIGLLPGLSTGFSALGSGIGGVAALFGVTMPASIGATMAALGPFILPILAVVAAIGLLAVAWTQNWGDIQGKTAAAWEAIQGIIGPAWEMIWGLIQTGLGALQRLWTASWQTIQTVLEGVWLVIQGTVQIAWSLVSGIIKIGLDILSGDWDQAWTDMQEMLAGVWEGIETTARGAWQAIVGVIRPAVNTILSFINALISGWNRLQFTIPGFSVEIPSITVPGVGTIGGGSLGWDGLTVSTPDLPLIPLLDAGAIVRRPTLAMLAGNNQPEAVMPLRDAGPLGITVEYHHHGHWIGTAQINERVDVRAMLREMAQFAGRELSQAIAQSTPEPAGLTPRM